MDEHVLSPGERLCDLGRRGYRLIQMPGEDCFSQDSVLLADFSGGRPGDRAADLGAGSGALSLLLLAREPGLSCGLVEIREDLCARAWRNAALNAVSDRMRVHCLDIREAPGVLGQGAFDLVVSNPPYHPVNGDDMRPGQRLARQQIACDYQALAGCAKRLLRHHGRFCLCFPAAHLVTVVGAMRENMLEPKRMRFVSAFHDRAPYLVLMEGKRNAKPGLEVMPQLAQFERPGVWTREMKAIYEEGGEMP